MFAVMRGPLPLLAGRLLSPGGLALLAGNAVPLAGVLLFGWRAESILVMYWMEAGVVGCVNFLRTRRAIAFGAAGREQDGSGAGRAIRSVPSAMRSRASTSRPPGSTPRAARAGGTPASLTSDASGVQGAPGAAVGQPGEGSTAAGTPRPDGMAVALAFLAAYLAFWVFLGVWVLDVASGGFYRGESRSGFAGVPPGVVVSGTLSLVAGQLAAYYLDFVRGRRYLTVPLIELTRDPFVRLLVLFGCLALGGIGIWLGGAQGGFVAAMVASKTVIEAWWATFRPGPAVTAADGEETAAPAPAPLPGGEAMPAEVVTAARRAGARRTATQRPAGAEDQADR
jgi:hypothetical protein